MKQRFNFWQFTLALAFGILIGVQISRRNQVDALTVFQEVVTNQYAPSSASNVISIIRRKDKILSEDAFLSNEDRRNQSESELQDVTPNPSELAEFIEDTKVRIKEMRGIELSNIIDRVSSELHLSSNQISLMRQVAVELNGPIVVNSDPVDLLSDYAELSSLDLNAQLDRRAREKSEDELLAALGEDAEPAVKAYKVQRNTRLTDAWTLGVMSELLMSVDVSETQRSKLYDALYRAALETQGPNPSGSQASSRRSLGREAILTAITPVLSDGQSELLRRRWTIHGLLGN